MTIASHHPLMKNIDVSLSMLLQRFFSFCIFSTILVIGGRRGVGTTAHRLVFSMDPTTDTTPSNADNQESTQQDYNDHAAKNGTDISTRKNGTDISTRKFKAQWAKGFNLKFFASTKHFLRIVSFIMVWRSFHSKLVIVNIACTILYVPLLLKVVSTL